MHRPSSESTAPKPGGSSQAPTRGRLFYWALVLVLGLLVCAGYFGFRSTGRKAEVATTVEEVPPNAASGAVADSAIAASSAPLPPPPSAPATERSAAEPAAASEAGRALADLQAIERIFQLDVSSGHLTPAQARVVDDSIRHLVSQGASAIPAIVDYLGRAQDVRLDTGDSRSTKPTARAALIGALNEIGGLAATEALAKTLQQAVDPFEIGLIAKGLEQQAPGEYKDDLLAAARASLKMAANGQLAERDVSPLFQIMQKYPEADVIGEMESAANQWGYYSNLALAGLPDGAGVNSLANRVRSASGSMDGESGLALQLLAQHSAQTPAAREALLDQVRSGRLPDSAWARIAEGLAGEQFYYGDVRLNEEVAKAPLNVRGYHIHLGNQNYVSWPLDPNQPAADAGTRREIIDSLLEQNISAAAREALAKARATLAGATPTP